MSWRAVKYLRVRRTGVPGVGAANRWKEAACEHHSCDHSRPGRTLSDRLPPLCNKAASREREPANIIYKVALAHATTLFSDCCRECISQLAAAGDEHATYSSWPQGQTFFLGFCTHQLQWWVFLLCTSSVIWSQCQPQIFFYIIVINLISKLTAIFFVRFRMLNRHTSRSLALIYLSFFYNPFIQTFIVCARTAYRVVAREVFCLLDCEAAYMLVVGF